MISSSEKKEFSLGERQDVLVQSGDRRHDGGRVLVCIRKLLDDRIRSVNVTLLCVPQPASEPVSIIPNRQECNKSVKKLTRALFDQSCRT